MKEKKPKRKFVVIIKTDINGIQNNFKKYRTNNIENFLKFMLKKYPYSLYANFYFNTGINKGSVFKTWGKNKGLI
jgi:hypothetical protein